MKDLLPSNVTENSYHHPFTYMYKISLKKYEHRTIFQTLNPRPLDNLIFLEV